jgi:Zn-dependent protease
LHLVWGAPELAAITRFNAWINLFNLLPFGPLDGGRGMNAMDRKQRWICVAALAVSFFANRDGLLLLLILLGVYRATMTDPAPEPDGRATVTYVGLVLVLTALSQVPVPGVPS